MSEYDREIGRTHGYLSQISAAAKVVTQVQLTELLIEKDWSVKQTKNSGAAHQLGKPRRCLHWI
jgi:hypothetical protein